MAPDIRLVHLSDLHLPKDPHPDSEILLDAFWEDVTIASDGIDAGRLFVVFSGDLVLAGASSEVFEEARSQFLDPLVKKLGISSDQIFLTPGNHDIDRDAVTDIDEAGLASTLIDRTTVNEFLDRPDDKTAQYFARLRYFRELRQYYGHGYLVGESPLFTAHRVELGAMSFGVACLNSAWRATGAAKNADYGNLLIGERQVDSAAKAIGDCDLSIATFHHPTSWLALHEQLHLAGHLNRLFRLLLIGHEHQQIPQYVHQPTSQTMESHGGCLYQGRDRPNSYAILDINLGAGKISVNLRSYDDQERRFLARSEVVPAGRYEFPLAPRDAAALAPHAATPVLRAYPITLCYSSFRFT